MSDSLNDALTKCLGCQAEISIKCAICPHCKAIADSSSSFLKFRYPSGGGGMMDQATAQFFRSNSPEPSQASLDALILRATRVAVKKLVFEGRTGTYEPCLEISGRADLEAFRNVVQIQSADGHLMAVPDRSLDFFQGEQLLAEIELVGAFVLRWSGSWKSDARIVTGDALAEFFAARGYRELRDQLVKKGKRAREEESKRRAWNSSWKAAIPAGLGRLMEQLQNEIHVPDAPSRTRALEVLAFHVPHASDQVLALLAWLGHGGGPWSGHPVEEVVPQSLLEMFDDGVIIAAASRKGLRPPHLEGASRYFCRWVPPARRPKKPLVLPPAIRKLLWDYVQASRDADKIARARPVLE